MNQKPTPIPQFKPASRAQALQAILQAHAADPSAPAWQIRQQARTALAAAGFTNSYTATFCLLPFLQPHAIHQPKPARQPALF